MAEEIKTNDEKVLWATVKPFGNVKIFTKFSRNFRLWLSKALFLKSYVHATYDEKLYISRYLYDTYSITMMIDHRGRKGHLTTESGNDRNG